MSDLLNQHPVWVAQTDKIKDALREQCGQPGTAFERLLAHQTSLAGSTSRPAFNPPVAQARVGSFLSR